MYVDYFALTENPFTIAPNPKYLYMSTRHQEALAHLLYGVQEGGGFVQLTGEVGTGKTTLTRALLQQLPDNVDPALIFNPKLSAVEFVAAICDELHIPYDANLSSLKTMVDALNAYLLNAHANGRRVVLIVDEAQNFQPDVLEQIRLLTNLETTQQKLLQIILVGQPELRELLARKELRQLAQRITARYHLVPMTLDETRKYLRHRLKVAGTLQEIFSQAAIKKIWQLTGGVPRLVNILADRCLLVAYASEESKVGPTFVAQAYAEVNALDKPSAHRQTWWLLPLVLLIMGAGAGLGYQLSITNDESKQVVTVAAPMSSFPEQVKAQAVDVVEATVSPELNQALSQAQSSPKYTAETLLRHITSQPVTADLNLAFQQLYALWSIDFSNLNGKTGCEKGKGVYKRCFWGSGTWSEYVTLNHPAIIWFGAADDSEQKHYVVIRQIKAGEVELQVAADILTLPVAEIEKIWPGKFLLLWQPPSIAFDILRPGDKGHLVTWLRDSVNNALGETSMRDVRSDVYDAALRVQVQTFQRQHGLDADGLVGEMTLLHLNARQSSSSMPLLNKE